MPNRERYSNTVIWLLVILIVIAIVAVVVIAIVLASSSTFGYGMMGSMMGYGAVFIVVPVLVIIIIIVALISLARPSYTPYPQFPYSPPQAMTPLQALELRYARGEITREQYEQIRSDLEGRGSQGRM